MVHKNEIKLRAKDLLRAIKDNYESCEEAGIDTTGSFVKQQYIADEMDELESVIKRARK